MQKGQRKITFVEAIAAEWVSLPASVKLQYEAEAKGRNVKKTENLNVLDRKQKYRDNSQHAW